MDPPHGPPGLRSPDHRRSRPQPLRPGRPPHQPPRLARRICPAVAPRPGDAVLDKDSADSFLDTGLDALLHEGAVRRVIVTGFATEYCVDSTSRAALSRGYDLVVVADGHTTPERPPGAAPTAAQVIAHHNATFSAIQYARRSITVTPAAEIRFTAAATGSVDETRRAAGARPRGLGGAPYRVPVWTSGRRRA
ncbi:isochorismatase family protein [Streptomyces sp. NPDC001594]|uniref:isochorismatase family protein n=1 Tax=Streptomyces sp. NPDC001594 TaxID=3364590 RepID=UPI00368078CD